MQCNSRQQGSCAHNRVSCSLYDIGNGKQARAASWATARAKKPRWCYSDSSKGCTSHSRAGATQRVWPDTLLNPLRPWPASKG
jgi:hypothetical protein